MTDKAKSATHDKPKTSALGMFKTALDTVASAFVETVEVPDHAAPEGAPVANRTPPAPAPIARLASPAAPPGVGSVAPDPDAQRVLESKLQKAMPAEYRSFMEQFQMLAEDIPDERTRFKVALKTTHITAEQLVGALDEMAAAMEAVRKEFIDGLTGDRDKMTAEAKKGLAATEQLIASNEEQLRAFEQKIITLRAKRDADTKALEDETARLEHSRLGFEAAYGEVRSHLDVQRRSLAAMLTQGKG